MSCQAGASAGQVWAGGVLVGCLERQENWAGRKQASFQQQVQFREPGRLEVGSGRGRGSQGKDEGSTMGLRLELQGPGGQ